MWFVYILGCRQDEEALQKDVNRIEQVSKWCDAGMGGPASSSPWQHDIARSHVGQRLFGPLADWVVADEILSAELLGTFSFSIDLKFNVGSF